MMKRYSLLCGTMLLWGFYAQAQSALEPASAETATAALQARITKVERGLSTRIVVRGSADQKMNLTDRMAYHQVPAVSIALINQGRVEWARAYGMADIASQRSATTTTLFQAGSVSKALSAMGAMRLVEQDKLSLDADANRQLVSWKIPQNEFTRDTAISLRMLLNHSAGTTVHGFMGYTPEQVLPGLVEVLNGVTPAHSEPVRVDLMPGTTWRYSGGGYSIIQLMMTEASKQPFDQLMKVEVLKPLEMNQSTFATSLPLHWRKQAATGYDAAGKAVAGGWHIYPESAAAGLWSTPSDLAKVILEVQKATEGESSKVLSRNSASLMLKRGLGEYGLGFFVEDLGDRTSFSHSGGTEGYRAQLYGYTRSGQGAVIMTNSQNGAALIDEILCSIAAEYGWPEYQVLEKGSIQGDAAINRQLAGDYQLLDLPAHVVAEGERLYFQSELFGAKRMELFPESKTTFFTTAQDMTLHFESSDDGAIIGFKLVRGMGTYPAKRMQ
ncbi:serine hydrolase [Rheinheimera sp. 4Y26]|uniref:serine hydrolase domain-containing protein n=1 Tax=Rheinheimera sp. 4Y26 TaxID=2977811 RepID=UPI0021B13ECB|nr:serine hydrolase domain-containing protein [Rheinheimera sp. 4Y26]MCT6698297.1 beta-lactamase family protein [Rheinheimera sp. 4Y26]